MSERFCELAQKQVKEYIAAVSKVGYFGAACFGRIGYDKLRFSSNHIGGVMGGEERRVVLVLESPHIYEFENVHKLACKGVAMGMTGRMIATYGGEIFARFRGWQLFVVNAVPFQCSLGMNLSLSSKIVKDVIVDEMLNDRATQLYLSGTISRLIARKHAVVVNACGGSNNRKKRIRAIVGQGVGAGVMIVECPHPSRWFNWQVRLNAVDALEKAWMRSSCDANDF